MDEINIRLELYKTMVETTTANEQRRQQFSTAYLSLMVAGIASIGALNNFDPLYVALPGIVVCVLWWSKIAYFRRLATAKFKVIKEYEKTFPVQPFGREWELFKQSGSRWGQIQLSLTYLEMIVPAVLGVCCFGYVLFRVWPSSASG